MNNDSPFSNAQKLLSFLWGIGGSGVSIAKLDSWRIARSKISFAARRVKLDDLKTLIAGDVRPFPGDVVLARVDEIGKQSRLELSSGRRAFMFPGDEILVAYGNRYAPDQFEAMVGVDLSPCDLVAAGGLASVELARSRKMITPTQITPLGLVGDAAGHRVNLMDYRIEASEQLPRIPAILSLGTSMNAGKSLTAASLVKGFKRLGHKVASLKITGTGSGGDLWIVSDAGADVVADFTDAGFASTYLTSIDALERAMYRLMNHAAVAGCEVAVVEIADGLQQIETRALIQSPAIQRVTLATMFAAYDSMGALSGVRTLRAAGHDLIGLSGKIGMTPLGVREAQASTDLKYYQPWDVQDGVLVPIIRQRAAEKLRTAPDGMEAALTRLASPLVEGPVAAGTGTGLNTGEPALSETVETAAWQVLHHVSDFIVQHDLRRLNEANPAGQTNGTRTPNRFEHRIWSSEFGLIHFLVPKLRNGAYRPRFLDRALPPEFVLSIVENIGTPRCDAALYRLVLTLGGPDFERTDLRPLRHTVEKFCAELGVTPALFEPEPCITTDELDQFFPGHDPATTEVDLPVLGFEAMMATGAPMPGELEEETAGLPPKRPN